jgi:hypothetical protein
MKSKLPAVLMILSTFSYAAAGTTAIGTVSARGDMRVDGYRVNGDATLFDGTVVETGQASAASLLDKGVEIKLAQDSRGTFYRDRLVLQQGISEWTPSGSFVIEANGLRVTPSEPNSHGVASLDSAHTVEIAALTGQFRVTNENGLLLARVGPGRPLSFAMMQSGTANTNPNSITVTGTLGIEKGAYFIIVKSTGVVYQLSGKEAASRSLAREVGAIVTISGTLDPNVTPSLGAAAIIDVSSDKEESSGTSGMSFDTKALIGVIIIGAAAGIAVGTIVATKSSTPASR